MKPVQNIFLIMMAALVMHSCLGDKKTVIGSDLGDTSFVNKNFKGNLINYTEGMSGCDHLTASFVANLYNRSSADIIITDPTKSNRYVNPAPGCIIHVKMSDQDFDHLTGSINVFKDIKSNEYMGDLAEATGGGENWEEAWALKKNLRKSTEWIEGIGQAALWTEKTRKLEIKFDGYSLEIVAPGAPFNTIEKAKNRDYKSVAMSIARASGYIK